MMDLPDVGALLGAGGQRIERQLGIASDRGQQIIEIVCHTACQSPNALHLLRLTQLLFQTPAVGDITHHYVRQRLTVPEEMSNIDLGWENAASSVPKDRLEPRSRSRVGNRSFKLGDKRI